MATDSPDADSGPDGLNNPAWDADDARRQNDQFAPPADPCECFCSHCHRTFMSDGIWFQKITGARDGFDGFWMCPTPNCCGAGFTFDIFPADPRHPANAHGLTSDDNMPDGACWFEEEDDFEFPAFLQEIEDDSDGEYDPAEPEYQMLDQWAAEDDDIEGEEWKYGLEPGQRPEAEKPDWLIEEEKKYDEPDRRPRELDWTDMERPERKGKWEDEDIPF